MFSKLCFNKLLPPSGQNLTGKTLFPNRDLRKYISKSMKNYVENQNAVNISEKDPSVVKISIRLGTNKNRKINLISRTHSDINVHFDPPEEKIGSGDKNSVSVYLTEQKHVLYNSRTDKHDVLVSQKSSRAFFEPPTETIQFKQNNRLPRSSNFERVASDVKRGTGDNISLKEAHRTNPYALKLKVSSSRQPNKNESLDLKFPGKVRGKESSHNPGKTLDLSKSEVARQNNSSVHQSPPKGTLPQNNPPKGTLPQNNVSKILNTSKQDVPLKVPKYLQISECNHYDDHLSNGTPKLREVVRPELKKNLTFADVINRNLKEGVDLKKDVHSVSSQNETCTNGKKSFEKDREYEEMDLKKTDATEKQPMVKDERNRLQEYFRHKDNLKLLKHLNDSVVGDYSIDLEKRKDLKKGKKQDSIFGPDTNIGHSAQTSPNLALLKQGEPSDFQGKLNKAVKSGWNEYREYFKEQDVTPKPTCTKQYKIDVPGKSSNEKEISIEEKTRTDLKEIVELEALAENGVIIKPAKNVKQSIFEETTLEASSKRRKIDESRNFEGVPLTLGLERPNNDQFSKDICSLVRRQPVYQLNTHNKKIDGDIKKSRDISSGQSLVLPSKEPEVSPAQETVKMNPSSGIEQEESEQQKFNGKNKESVSEVKVAKSPESDVREGEFDKYTVTQKTGNFEKKAGEELKDQEMGSKQSILLTEVIKSEKDSIKNDDSCRGDISMLNVGGQGSSKEYQTVLRKYLVKQDTKQSKLPKSVDCVENTKLGGPESKNESSKNHFEMCKKESMKDIKMRHLKKDEILGTYLPRVQDPTVDSTSKNSPEESGYFRECHTGSGKKFGQKNFYKEYLNRSVDSSRQQIKPMNSKVQKGESSENKKSPEHSSGKKSQSNLAENVNLVDNNLPKAPTNVNRLEMEKCTLKCTKSRDQVDPEGNNLKVIKSHLHQEDHTNKVNSKSLSDESVNEKEEVLRVRDVGGRQERQTNFLKYANQSHKNINSNKEDNRVLKNISYSDIVSNREESDKRNMQDNGFPVYLCHSKTYMDLSSVEVPRLEGKTPEETNQFQFSRRAKKLKQLAKQGRQGRAKKSKAPPKSGCKKFSITVPQKKDKISYSRVVGTYVLASPTSIYCSIQPKNLNSEKRRTFAKLGEGKHLQPCQLEEFARNAFKLDRTGGPTLKQYPLLPRDCLTLTLYKVQQGEQQMCERNWFTEANNRNRKAMADPNRLLKSSNYRAN